MPYRALNLAVALVGVLFVLSLVFLGLDIGRAAGRSPRRRRLLTAGILLLASFGLTMGCSRGSSGSNTAGGAATSSTMAAQSDLADTRQWKQLTAAWREAEEIASGSRGGHPFTPSGKKKVLQSLADASVGADLLQTAGLLSSPEAGLLKEDLVVLARKVESFRATDMRNATCYLMSIPTAKVSADRLSARLPLLEKLAAQQTIHPEVLDKILNNLEADLKDVRENKAPLSPADRKQADQVARDVRVQLEKIRARMSGKTSPLDGSNDWQIISAAWKEAAPLAVAGASTTRQRESAKAKLDAARTAAANLAAARLITGPEGRLILSEADRLQKDIYRNPPTDTQVECYKMVYLPPVRQSLDRIAARLPLLQQLAQGGVVHRTAVEKVVASVEADLKELSNEKELAALTPAQKLQAQQQSADARKALAQIKSLWTSNDAAQ